MISNPAANIAVQADAAIVHAAVPNESHIHHPPVISADIQRAFERLSNALTNPQTAEFAAHTLSVVSFDWQAGANAIVKGQCGVYPCYLLVS